MTIITKKINDILQEKNLSRYKLSELMDFPEGALGMMIRGKSPFSEKALKRLLPILNVTKEEFDSWVLADKYPKEILKLAIQTKKEFPYKRKSILTTNIDKLLQEKAMSRTTLAKQINYSQSGLNRMITRKINMSKPILEKVSQVLELSQDEVLSWIVADKYSLLILEKACDYVD